MGFLDKAKNLGSKALDGAKTATSTVMDKTGASEKLHIAKIKFLAFCTEEQLRTYFDSAVYVGSEATKYAASSATKKLEAKITDTIGVSFSIEDYMEKIVASFLNEAVTEENIEASFQRILQERKNAQSELLEIW